MTRLKVFMTLVTLCVVTQGAWAQTEVSTELELREAIENGTTVSVKLMDDIIPTDVPLGISSGKTITIDLNGHSLSRTLDENQNYGMVIYVNGGNLTINDSSGDNSGSIEGGRSYNGGGILCESGSTLTINGGTFRNNIVSRTDNGDHGRGGAIFMNPNTTLTVTGGKFENNSAYNGGAIYLDDGGPDSGTPASATISGSTISGCSAQDCGAIYNKGTLTISGGEIKNCTSERGGGGVVNYGTATISGGTISDNHATTGGGGVWNGESATLTITGGTITGNTAVTNGGGIFSYSSFRMSGNPVVKLNMVNNRANNLYLNGSSSVINCGAFTTGASIGVSLPEYNRAFSSGFSTNNGSAQPGDYFFPDRDRATLSLSNEGEIYLELTYVETEDELNNAIDNGIANITIAADFTVASHVTIRGNTTIDLNGYTLRGNSTALNGSDGIFSCIFIVADTGNLTLKNGTLADADNSVTSNQTHNGGAIVNKGTATLTNVTITNCKGVIGGAIHNNTGGTLTLTDCIIQNNSAPMGGGIVNAEGGKLYITGGEISDNSSSNGGGIFNIGGISSNGRAEITNCTIKNNQASRAGGIWNDDNGSLYLTGCTVTGNTSELDGGGFWNKGTATLTDCTFTGNTATTDGGGIWNHTILTMTDCTVDGNTAGDEGGGIYNTGAIRAEGNTVTNNTAYTTGGGIWNGDEQLMIYGITVTGNSSGCGSGIYSCSDIRMEGLCNITGNNGTNLYLTGDYVINCIIGPFTAGTSIGVGLENYDRVFTKNFGHQSLDYFIPDLSSAILEYSVSEDVYEAKLTANGIVYMERSWTGSDTEGQVVAEQKICTTYHSQHISQEVSGSTQWFPQGINSGEWNYINRDFTYTSRIVISSDTRFILKDGVTVTFEKGIHINDGCTLTIYDQTAGTGKLRATGDDGSANNGDAAIGGNNDAMGGSLVIHGGTIEAKPSHNCAAGIGGGQGENSGMQSVTIWGGTITAEGTSDGAGIGGGEYNRGPAVTIYGGTVTAKGGDNGAGIGGGEDRGNGTVTIYGGTIIAKGGEDAAGIGGGEEGGVDNPIYIYGGTVTATSDDSGAGIGGGYGGHVNGPITIYGGNVTAESGTGGAGIGGGARGDNNSTITINGGTVKAAGTMDQDTGQNWGGAGIGGGGGTANYHAGTGGTIIINGGYVEADAYYYGAGIGSGFGHDNTRGGDIYINGGTVKIRVDIDRHKETLKKQSHFIGSPCYNDGDFITDHVYNDGELTLGPNMKLNTSDSDTPVACSERISTCRSDYNTYDYILLSPCDHEDTSYTPKDADHHTIACSYCEMSGTDEAHTYGDYSECGLCHLVSLADGSDNSSIISHWGGETKSVVLTGRTLYKDDSWNTLCLPFDFTLSGDLASATVMELDPSTGNYANVTGYDGGTLYLNFKDGPTTLQAGVPYIVKWDAVSPNYVESPIFTDVTFVDGVPSSVASQDCMVSFTGNYHPVNIPGEDRTILYMGDDNNLYYPNDKMDINSFRAYFQLNGVTAGDITQGGNINAFVLNFGGDDAAGIGNIQSSIFNIQSEGWYSLDGRMFNGKPKAKGVYIHKGKKHVIK